MSPGKTLKYKTEPTKQKGKATLVDKQVGENLRTIRLAAGLSQMQLAARIGVTFQQLQKYENGSNRLSSSRLYELANALGTPISAFFNNLDAQDGKRRRSDKDMPGLGEQQTAPSNTKETLDLLRIYYSIKDENLRKNLLAFSKELAKNLSR